MPVCEVGMQCCMHILFWYAEAAASGGASNRSWEGRLVEMWPVARAYVVPIVPEHRERASMQCLHMCFK